MFKDESQAMSNIGQLTLQWHTAPFGSQLSVALGENKYILQTSFHIRQNVILAAWAERNSHLLLFKLFTDRSFMLWIQYAVYKFINMFHSPEICVIAYLRWFGNVDTKFL